MNKTELNAAMKRILELLNSFPQTEKASQKLLGASYVEAISKSSLGAVLKACEKFRNGEIANRNSEFAPSVASFMEVVRKQEEFLSLSAPKKAVADDDRFLLFLDNGQTYRQMLDWSAKMVKRGAFSAIGRAQSLFEAFPAIPFRVIEADLRAATDEPKKPMTEEQWDNAAREIQTYQPQSLRRAMMSLWEQMRKAAQEALQSAKAHWSGSSPPKSRNPATGRNYQSEADLNEGAML